MNIAKLLPEPLNSFELDVPENTYYDFELEPDSTYPLPGVTYPVDYGNIPEHISEDGHELDLFVGHDLRGEVGSVVVYRGDDRPDETKFYAGLSQAEVTKVLNELKPVLRQHTDLETMSKLLEKINKFKVN